MKRLLCLAVLMGAAQVASAGDKLLDFQIGGSKFNLKDQYTPSSDDDNKVATTMGVHAGYAFDNGIYTRVGFQLLRDLNFFDDALVTGTLYEWTVGYPFRYRAVWFAPEAGVSYDKLDVEYPYSTMSPLTDSGSSEDGDEERHYSDTSATLGASLGWQVTEHFSVAYQYKYNDTKLGSIQTGQFSFAFRF